MKKRIAAILVLVMLSQALPWTAFASAGLGDKITEAELQRALNLAGLITVSNDTTAGSGPSAKSGGRLLYAANDSGMLELEAKDGEYHEGMEPEDTWDAQMFMDYLEDKISKDLFNVTSVFTRAETLLDDMRTADPDAYARFTGGDNAQYVEDCHWWVLETEKVEEEMRFLDKRLRENVSIIEQNTEYLANSDADTLFDYEITRLSNQIRTATDEIAEVRKTIMNLIIADMLLIESGQHTIDGTNEPEFSAWLHSVLSHVEDPREANVSANAIQIAADTRASRLTAGRSVLSNESSGDVTVMVINNNQFAIELHGVGNRPVGDVPVTVRDLNGTYSETLKTAADTGSVVFNANRFVGDEDQEMEISLEVDASAQGYRSFYIPWTIITRGGVRRETLVLLTGPETADAASNGAEAWETKALSAANDSAALPYIYSCQFNGYDCRNQDKTVIISSLNDSELDITVEVDNPSNVPCDPPVLHYWCYNSGGNPMKAEMYPTSSQPVRGTTRTKYVYRKKWKQILTPDINADQKPYFVLPSTGEVVRTKLTPVLSAVSKPLTTGEEPGSPLAKVMGKGFGYDFSIPLDSSGSKKLKLSLNLPFDQYLPKVAIDPFGYVTVTMGASKAEPKKHEFWKTDETEAYRKEMKKYEHEMDKASKLQQLGSAYDMYKKMANKKGMGAGKLDFGFFVMLGGKGQYDKDDGKTYWSGKGEIGGSITLGYNYTQVFMAPVIPIPFYLNIGITLSAGAGLGLSFECVTSRDGDMLDYTVDIIHDITIDIRLTVSVTFGAGIKGLLSAWISGTGTLNILLRLAANQPVRFDIYFEAMFSVGVEAFFVSVSYVIWKSPRLMIYSFPRDEGNSANRAFSLFAAYAEAEAEESQTVEPVYYEPRRYASLAPEAQVALSGVENTGTGVKVVSAEGHAYVFFLGTEEQGCRRVSWADVETGRTYNAQYILDRKAASVRSLNDYAFDVISDGESIVLLAFSAKNFNEAGYPVAPTTPQLYSNACYAMRLKRGSWNELEVQGKVFSQAITYRSNVITDPKIDEMQVGGDGTFAAMGCYQVIDGTGAVKYYETFAIINSASMVRYLPSRVNAYSNAAQRSRLSLQTFLRYDSSRPSASTIAHTYYNGGWIGVDRSENDPENSSLEVWLPGMFGTDEGLKLAEGDIRGYALVQTKDTAQPRYAQTIFYTQRETASERTENRLKGIYIAPKADISRTDTQFDISFTDYDLSIPASDFYTVTLGTSQYLYWLTTAEKEDASDPNIWRICGVYYDAVTGAVSDQIVIAEFTLPDTVWKGQTCNSVPAEITLTDSGVGYIIARPSTGDEDDRDIAPMTVYSFPIALKSAVSLQGAAMLETTVLQGAFAATEFSLMNIGNTGIGRFDLDVVLMEDGKEAGTVETLHANLLYPEESSIEMDGESVVTGERALYRLKDFTYSPRQSEFTVSSESKTFILNDGKPDSTVVAGSEVNRVSTNVLVPGALGAFSGNIKIPSDWEGKYELRLKVTGFSAYANVLAVSKLAETRPELFAQESVQSKGLLAASNASANTQILAEMGVVKLDYALDETSGKLVLQNREAINAIPKDGNGTRMLFAAGENGSEALRLYPTEIEAPEPVTINCEVHDIDVNHRLYDDYYGEELLDIVIRNYCNNDQEIGLNCAMYLNGSNTPEYVSLPYDPSVLSADTTTTITLPVKTLFDPETTESARFVILPRNIRETATINNEFTIYPGGTSALRFIQDIWAEITRSGEVITYTGAIPAREGETVTLHVGVTGGTKPYSYQWQVYNPATGEWVNLKDGKGISGANTDILTLQKVKGEWDGRQARCVVTDSSGTTITSASITLRVAQSGEPTPPDTGDHSNLPLYLTIAALALIALILIRRRRRVRSQRCEH